MNGLMLASVLSMAGMAILFASILAFANSKLKVEEDPKNPENLLTRVYYDKALNDMVYSVENPGEPADFSEGMTILWEAYPQKNNYIRGDKGGSGGTGGSGGGADNESKDNDLASLQKQYDEAVAAGQASRAITLKNRIWSMKQARKNAA